MKTRLLSAHPPSEGAGGLEHIEEGKSLDLLVSKGLNTKYENRRGTLDFPSGQFRNVFEAWNNSKALYSIYINKL